MTAPPTLPAIAQLLPHRPPMVLLDEVVSFAAEGITCSALVRASCLFVQDGQLATTVTIEHMAQAIAAHEGMRASAGQGPIDIGFLISCREMLVHQDWIQVGSVLTVRARCVSSARGLGNFACRIELGGVCVSEAELSVASPELVREWQS